MASGDPRCLSAMRLVCKEECVGSFGSRRPPLSSLPPPQAHPDNNVPPWTDEALPGIQEAMAEAELRAASGEDGPSFSIMGPTLGLWSAHTDSNLPLPCFCWVVSAERRPHVSLWVLSCQIVLGWL